MARLRICPDCNFANPLSEGEGPVMHCLQCHRSISDVTPTQPRGALGDQALTSDTALDRAPGGEPAPHQPRYELAFPWGRHAVLGCLNIGREPAFSTIAERIQQVDVPATVSRMHATLYVDPSGMLQLKDLGAKNCTYVNGDPISQGRPIGLVEGDEVSFSSSLTATVHRVAG